MASAASPRPSSVSPSATGAGGATLAPSSSPTGGALTSPSQNTPSAAGANRCHTCQGEIKAAQFIRVGEFKFHKDHFTCCMCNKSLHGQKFHPKDGKFYCADDFILKFCHTCGHCRNKILVGSVIQACGNFYHPEHFVCCVCEKPFKNGQYFASDKKPYCEEHYLQLTCEKCDTCRKPILDEASAIRIGTKAHHPGCLSCSHCGIKPTVKGSIYQKDGKVYCQEDYQNFFCKRCTACGVHLIQNCVVVNDEYYHTECLVCSVCTASLKKYICVEGHLRCEQHTDFTTDKFTCVVCTRIIDPPTPVRCCGQKCHEECFKCHYCSQALTKATCTLRNDKLCCGRCIFLKDDELGIGRSRSATSPPPAKSSLTTSITPGSGVNITTTSTSTSRASAPAGMALGLDDSAATHARRASEAVTPTERKTPSGSVSDEKKALPSPGPSKRSADSKKAPKEKIEYKRGELIGKGSFGKVFMGMNAKTGELIAIKQVVIKSTEDNDTAKEIENEISLMHNLRHPHIVTLLETQRVGNKLNILMEYVPGKSMDTMLEKFGAFTEKVIQSYTRQLLQALEYCHQNHVVHRDIKGKNILIDTKGTLKLADFGSAKRFQNVMSNAAPSVGYNYTPLWTAPEVLVGDYNSKVDIWSLGCVIIEMASGKPPWSEENFENPFRALYHIGNSGSIPKIPDTVSAVGRAFILMCLERDPQKRPDATTLLQQTWLAVEEDAYADSGDEDEHSGPALHYSS